LWAGVSPGTVLVFLLAGPASNMAGLALVRREFGTPALVAYLVGVAGVSLLAGIGLDAAAGLAGWSPLDGVTAESAHAHSEGLRVLQWISLLVLATAGARLLVKRREAADCCGEG
jgi:hypothetical protein